MFLLTTSYEVTVPWQPTQPIYVPPQIIAILVLAGLVCSLILVKSILTERAKKR
jgi:hypothetical protein